MSANKMTVRELLEKLANLRDDLQVVLLRDEDDINELDGPLTIKVVPVIESSHGFNFDRSNTKGATEALLISVYDDDEIP